MNQHSLHGIIGDCISNMELPNCEPIMSSECGGPHNVPLYCSSNKSNETKYCNVDILILKNNKIRVIIEIEESDITPNRIFGKFLASALSSYFIHESKNYEPITMDDSVLFIQILDKSKLKVGSSKIGQGENIEKSIQSIIPLRESKIDNYRLFYGEVSEFKDGDKRSELTNCIKEFLK